MSALAIMRQWTSVRSAPEAISLRTNRHFTRNPRLNWDMRLGYAVLIFIGAVVLGRECLHAQDQPAVHRITVPMSVEGNAPIITLAFKTPQGSLRSARFLFDSGGGAIILGEGLARDIGLKSKSAVLSDDGQQYQEVDLLSGFVGEMQVNLQ